MSRRKEKRIKFPKQNDDNKDPDHEHRYEDPNGHGAEFNGGRSEVAKREVWF